MASIINASSTGSGGIVQTADASGVLQLQTNGTVALSIDTSANITFADGSKNLTLQQTTAAGANSTSYPGYIAFTGYGWNTSLGSSPLGVRLAAGGNYTPDLGQVAPGLSISTQNTNGSMTQRMLLNGYGIGLGTGTYPISGTGVKFPASQDASNDANTLDDYEEGTWTPNPQNNGSTSSFSSKVGYYRKVGSVVTCWFSCNSGSSNGGSGSGAVILNGLPFAMAVGNQIFFMGQVAATGVTNASGYDWISSAGGTSTGAQILYNAAGNQEQGSLTGVNGVFTYIAS